MLKPHYKPCVVIINLQPSFNFGFIFTRSRTSVADDYVEEHKLLGQDSERVKYLTLGQLDADEVNGEVSGNNEETIAHLRECIKTERDQKVSTSLS